MSKLLAILLSVCCVGTALAQTTRAVPAGWPRAVEDLAEALVSSDAGTLSRLMSDAVTVRPLSDELDEGDALPLIRRSHGATVVMARAYVQPPLALASDIANQLSSSQVVSESVRERLWVDGHAAQRANATAAQWVGELLGAKPGDLVGVILLWRAPESSVAARTESSRPPLLFVLVKAAAGVEGIKVTSVVFGTPPELSEK